MASRWKATPRSASFTLRDGVQCADGSRLTARDVADNVNFITDPKNRPPLLGVLVNPGVSEQATTRPAPVAVTSPAARRLSADVDGERLHRLPRRPRRPQIDRTRRTNGTGPWQLDEAVPDDHYRFTPHDGYAWGPDGARLGGPGTPDTVNVRIVPNITTTANLLLPARSTSAT